MRFIISFIYAGFSRMALSFCHRFRRKMYPKGVPQRFCLAVPVISYSQELISQAVANLHRGLWGWGGGQRQGNKTHMILTNLTQFHSKKGNTLHVNKHCFVAINSSQQILFAAETWLHLRQIIQRVEVPLDLQPILLKDKGAQHGIIGGMGWVFFFFFQFLYSHHFILYICTD